ncbi:unnamed protein product [Cladocopium goreaui]|uniref:C3H1-type domain-containing protein n=1 Tax=Cladocopium goreaui TaxID=2562237 RepID=A0A9P1DFY6_9DINO|nr:unnamed protein product [Cladocopium goreaui]
MASETAALETVTQEASASDMDVADVGFESLPGYAKLSCNQCLFFASQQGCSKGSSCSFCHHLVTEEEAQLAAARPRKVRRKRIKANLKEMLQKLNASNQQPEEVLRALQAEAQRNQYARLLGQHLVDRWLDDKARASRRAAVLSAPAASVPAGLISSGTSSSASGSASGSPEANGSDAVSQTAEAPSDEPQEFCRALLRFSV